MTLMRVVNASIRVVSAMPTQIKESNRTNASPETCCIPSSTVIAPFCVPQGSSCCGNTYCEAGETCCGGSCCPAVSLVFKIIENSRRWIVNLKFSSQHVHQLTPRPAVAL